MWGLKPRERDERMEKVKIHGARPTRVDEVDGKMVVAATRHDIKRGWRESESKPPKGSQLATGAQGGEGTSMGIRAALG